MKRRSAGRPGLALRGGRLEFRSQTGLQLLGVSSFARPYDDPFPAKFAQPFCVASVPFDVPLQFAIPIGGIALRLPSRAAFLAIVSVPETAVDEDHGLQFRQHNIRL